MQGENVLVRTCQPGVDLGEQANRGHGSAGHFGLHGLQAIIEGVGSYVLRAYFALRELNVQRRLYDAELFEFLVRHVGGAIGNDLHHNLLCCLLTDATPTR